VAVVDEQLRRVAGLGRLPGGEQARLGGGDFVELGETDFARHAQNVSRTLALCSCRKFTSPSFAERSTPENEGLDEMTADELVVSIAAVFDDDNPPGDVAVVKALVESGVPERQADIAVKLVQIACGRILLDGLGIQFSDLYLCFDSQGREVERGALSRHAVFTAALVRMMSAPRALELLAITSAEVQTVNTLLHQGADPADLMTGPSALFVEVPTEAGLAAGNAVVMEMLKKRVNP
jgi:hypothetical protein